MNVSPSQMDPVHPPTTRSYSRLWIMDVSLIFYLCSLQQITEDRTSSIDNRWIRAPRRNSGRIGQLHQVSFRRFVVEVTLFVTTIITQPSSSLVSPEGKMMHFTGTRPLTGEWWMRRSEKKRIERKMPPLLQHLTLRCSVWVKVENVSDVWTNHFRGQMRLEQPPPQVDC